MTDKTVPVAGAAREGLAPGERRVCTSATEVPSAQLAKSAGMPKYAPRFTGVHHTGVHRIGVYLGGLDARCVGSGL